MTDRSIVVSVRVATAAGIVVAATGTVVNVAAGQVGYWWTSHSGVLTLIVVGLCAVVWFVIPFHPRNASVWAMATAPAGSVAVLASAIAPIVADQDPSAFRYQDYVPAEHARSVAWLLGIGEMLTSIGVFVPLTLGLLLFPTGTIARPRWRRVAWAALATNAAAAILTFVAYRPDVTGPPAESSLLMVAQSSLVAAMFLSIAAVLMRFRSSTGDTRQQIKWVWWGAGIAAMALAIGMNIAGTRIDWLSAPVVFCGFGALIASYGVAIAKYRLYDVDVVISRTIVYASLATIITAVYVGVVVGVSELSGSSDGPHTGVAIITTGAVAAAFQPLRQRVQRFADRLVYGKRATPHEVLSELTRRVAANDDGLLELAARSLVDGTGAGRVEVRVTAGGREMTAAEWPPSSGNGSEDMSRFPITHRGTELGALVLAVPSGQHLADVDRVLATQVASSMGLALKNRSLTETLQRRVVQLRESRRRLVAVQDATRRRVERDLHDGAQQQLVALRVKLGLARAMADADGAAATLTAVDRLGDEADRVVDAVRDFARGVYPPLLEAEGIGAAVTAAARQCPIHVSVDVDEIGRHDRDAESAVYACVVEALDNVAVHAAAHQAWVRISSCESALSFEVRDDGAGFDIGAVPRGVGLTNIADRVDALAGHVSMRSAPGCGTSVGGEIPVESVVRS